MATHLTSMPVRDRRGNVRVLHIIRTTYPSRSGPASQPTEEHYLLDGAPVEPVGAGVFRVVSTGEKLSSIEL